MINKNNLLGVSGLKLQAISDSWGDSEYNAYSRLLDDFIDKFPLQETILKNCFKSGELEKFVHVLTELKSMLAHIYAEDLASKCDGLLKSIINPNRDMAEASLSYFLTLVSMLSIEIQMAKHKKELSENESAVGESAEAKVQQKSILAVDDVSLLLSTLRASLLNTEYKFTGVTSGAAALRFLANHTVDLFLLDIEMPEMNGYELAQKIQSEGHTAPIIFLTGNAKKEYVIKAMQVGAVDFIVKPVNKEQVMEKIKKYIG